VLRLIGNGLIFWAAAVSTASVLVHARVPWRHSEMGRHLMAYMGALALVLVLSCVRLVVGDAPWFQTLRLIVFVAIPLTMTWRLWLQVKTHRLDRKDAGHGRRPR